MSKKTKAMIAVAIGLILLIPAVAVAADRFSDVPDTSSFHDDIGWLADAGVTLGCNPPANDKFCPGNNVTRQQMAAFMRRFAQFLDAEDGVVAEADHAADASTLQGLAATNLLGSRIIVRRDQVTVPDGGTATAFASCNAGEVLIGGGTNLSLFVNDVFILSSRPNPNSEGSIPTSWVSSASNPAGGTGGSIEIRAYAMCSSFSMAPTAALEQQTGEGAVEP